MSKNSGNGYIAAEDLKRCFERIEAITEQIKELQDDRKDVFGEYKSKGFDVPTIKNVLKLRKLTPDDRLHQLSMIEVYMAAVGMGEASLSDMAREFLAGRNSPAPDLDADGDDEIDAPTVPSKFGDQPDGDEPAVELTVDDARRLGAEAQAAGRPVTANPFPPRDPRRAAWDESWCSAAGSDGMDIPDFLKSDKALADGKAAAEKRRAEEEAEGRVIAADAASALDAAREFVVGNQSGSTSGLQSALGLTFKVAAAVMDALEGEGVVSAPDVRGKREVLRKPEDAE